jgi:hypothetical protein
VDLRPPTVVRLERTLAHWNSRDSVRCKGRTCRASRGQILARPRPGTPTDATGVSLLTVKAIGAQVKPSRARRPVLPVRPATIMEHCDFHSASAAGDLGCGKTTSADRPGGS